MHSNSTVSACPFSGRQLTTATLSEVYNDQAATGRGQGVTARRRSVLAGALGLATMLTGGGLTRTAPAFAGVLTGRRAIKSTHGQALRGLDIAARYGRDREARFGLMFKTLPAFSPTDKQLKELALTLNDHKAPLSDVKDTDVAFDTAIPAGYVYFGQFLDHDITLDKTPLAKQRQDIAAMKNFDSPRLDLGSVYGGGPTLNPELYDPARPGYLKVDWHGQVPDVPRDEVGAAFLGDPRNDENLLVSQFHTIFMRLHNKFRDEGKTFEQARELTRWHFQWLVVHDYLPRIVGQSVVDSILRTRPDGRIAVVNKFYKPRNAANPYIPIEFSGAAYRFGHSQIRAEYEVHDQHTVPIFARDGYEDLRGNRPMPEDLWIDWNYFFEIPGLSRPDDPNMARCIDTDISLPLSTLPSTVVAPTAGAIIDLSERNLLRGKRLGLPCGQDVATAMGIKPIANAKLGLNSTWKNKAPLWFYLLAEAELLGGAGLGPVGGRIVAEVLLGLIAADPSSYFNSTTRFTLSPTFAMGDLILLADALDPRSRIVSQDVPVVVDPEDPEAPEEPEVLEEVPLEPDEVINPEAVEPLPGLV